MAVQSGTMVRPTVWQCSLGPWLDLHWNMAVQSGTMVSLHWNMAVQSGTMVRPTLEYGSTVWDHG
jgi:hypothetical protein